MKLQIKNLKL